MDRLLMLQLDAVGTSAEVLLNGMPVARVGPGGGRVSLAVHEYTLTGRNQLALTVGDLPGAGPPGPSQPRVAGSALSARARLVLLRQGHTSSDERARELAVLDWAAAEGTSHDAPASVRSEVELPVSFPRWRWLDAPAIGITPALRRKVLEFVQQLAVELGRGHAEGLVGASRLRLDELALAYQIGAADVERRLREHLQALYAAKALKIVPPTADDLVLRPVHDGRLIECLTPLGGPVLHTRNEPPTDNHAWPIRLAVVESKIYVLR